MPTYRFYQIDAFTTEAFKGNAAGVVPDARGLEPADMQAIARELNQSETAFVFPAEGGDHDMRVRFFTPRAEVPICGHATIASHYVLALESGAEAVTTRQLTGAGILKVEVENDEAGRTLVWMHQQPASFEAPLHARFRDLLASALGITAEDIDDRSPVQIVSTGHSKVMVPLRRRATLRRLQPDLTMLERLSGDIGCNGFYPFTLEAPDPGMLAHGRMFAPAIGIPEDPVTGNASGCLGVYLLHHKLARADPAGALRFKVGQGSEIGRAGQVQVHAWHDAEGAENVRIGGNAVVAFTSVINP